MAELAHMTHDEPRQTRREREWWEEDDEAPELEGLPKGIISLLVTANIKTISQLRVIDPAQLLEIEGMGKTRVQRIKNWLREKLMQPRERDEDDE